MSVLISTELLIANTNVRVLWLHERAGMASSVLRLSTGWTVLGSNPGGERDFLFSAPVHSGLGVQPASCTVGTGALSWGVKQSGRGFDHPLLIYRRGLGMGGAYPWIALCAGNGMLWSDLYLYLKAARKCKKKKRDRCVRNELHSRSSETEHRK